MDAKPARCAAHGIARITVIVSLLAGAILVCVGAVIPHRLNNPPLDDAKPICEWNVGELGYVLDDQYVAGQLCCTLSFGGLGVGGSEITFCQGVELERSFLGGIRWKQDRV